MTADWNARDTLLIFAVLSGLVANGILLWIILTSASSGWIILVRFNQLGEAIPEVLVGIVGFALGILGLAVLLRRFLAATHPKPDARPQDLVRP